MTLASRFKRLLRSSKRTEAAATPNSSSVVELSAPVTHDDATSLGSEAASGPASVVATTQLHALPERLWNRAYDLVKDEEASLVRAYELILSQELDGCPSGGTPQHTISQVGTARQAQMQNLIQARLKKTERQAKVMQSVGGAMHVVLSAKEIIDTAIQAIPQAAFAWAGVCVALQILMNPTEASSANQKGIAHVVTRLDWYWNLASLLLEEDGKNSMGRPSASLRIELEKRIVCLYKELLLYQMRSVCSYFRNRGLDFLRSLAQLDDWNGSMTKINEAEAALRQDSADYGSQQVLLRLDQLVLATKNLESKLVDVPSLPAMKVAPCAYPMLVPFGRNKNFVGRDSIVAQLLDIIPPDTDSDDCQLVAIEGLGGIGKTQIALEAAFRVRERDENCGVFWVPLIDAATFENAYREIARQLEIPGNDNDKADIKLLVKSALSQSTQPWLLIIDNADDVDLLFGTSGSVPLRDYLPFNRKGSILFTTRNHEAAVKLDIPPARIVRLEEMSRPEALEFLHANLSLTQIDDYEATTSLLHFLAYLPLALKQASAYMAKTGMTVPRYLTHCRSSDMALAKLLSKDFEDRGRYKTIENPIATTWLISFDHICRDNPLAAHYLMLMSLLAEKNVSKSLVTIDDDVLEADEAIGTLKAYAFISERAEQESYDMHRLVRLAMRNWLLEKGRLQPYIATAIWRLYDLFRGVWQIDTFTMAVTTTVAGLTACIPHVSAVLEFQDEAREKDILFKLLRCLARTYFKLGNSLEELKVHERLLKLLTAEKGPENHETLTTMLMVCNGLIGLCRHPEADVLAQQGLVLSRKFFDAEIMPDRFMELLARSFGSQGRLTEAETLLRKAVEHAEQVPGFDDENTCSLMTRLAENLALQGKYDEAERLARQAMAIAERARGGSDQCMVYAAMFTLARAVCQQGRDEEAVSLCQRAVEMAERKYGARNTIGLPFHGELAQHLNHQKRHQEAELLARQVLESAKEFIPDDYPGQLTMRRELAACIECQGRLEEAEDEYRRTLKLELTKSNVSDTDVTYIAFVTMLRLAICVGRQGRFDEEEVFLRKALEGLEKLSGPKDTETLFAMHALGKCCGKRGMQKESEELFQRWFDIRETLFGNIEVEVLRTMHGLADGIESQGRYEEAAELFRKALEGRTKLLGVGHRETLESMDALVSCAHSAPTEKA